MASTPSPDSVLAVGGFAIGHWTDAEAGTGCTVVVCDPPAVAGVDIRGSAPGVRETALLEPTCLVDRVDAVVLTGGSSLGLASASGVAAALRAAGRGFPTSAGPVPIVPAAVVFDLGVGRSDTWPGESSGAAAYRSASVKEYAEGNVGAGAGVTAGSGGAGTKTGIGSTLVRLGALLVGALIVPNPVGCILDEAGRPIAGPLRDGKLIDPEQILHSYLPALGENTVIGVILTNAALDKVGATKVAQMAHDGIARAVRPAHTMWDGDTLFCLCSGAERVPADRSLVGDMAAQAVAAAIRRGAMAAEPAHGLPSARSLGLGR